MASISDVGGRYLPHIISILFNRLQMLARRAAFTKAGLKPARNTADIDFAVMVPDLKNMMCCSYELCSRGFKKTTEATDSYTIKRPILDLLAYWEKLNPKLYREFDARDISFLFSGFKESR